MCIRDSRGGDGVRSRSRSHRHDDGGGARAPRPHRGDDDVRSRSRSCLLYTSVSAGKSVQTALQEASAASALAVSRTGAAPSVPTADEVREFLRRHA